MTEYEPGTVAVATVRGVPNVRILRREVQHGRDWAFETYKGGVKYTCSSDEEDVTDIRPLVVLDLHEAPIGGLRPGSVDLANWLRLLASSEQEKADLGLGIGGPRRRFARWIADQIEAQTKPARIPEPGKWGVVRAKGRGLAEVEWVNEGKYWVSIGGDPNPKWAKWDELNDPTLVREGVGE